MQLQKHQVRRADESPPLDLKSPEPAPARPADQPQSTAGRLLDAKRRARKKLE